MEEPDHGHCRLLRARGERPRGRRTADERDYVNSRECRDNFLDVDTAPRDRTGWLG
jgi:hypothetical protein